MLQYCGDAISRQAVLDYIYNDLGLGDEENGKDVERAMELERSYKYVKSLPPVNPQQKTGRWINRHIIANKSIDMIVCSECGEEFSYDAETGISEYNYCPNCGAKMEEQA